MSAVARVTTRDVTLPIVNVPMAELVGMGEDFDEVPTVVYTIHEREAMAALARVAAMRSPKSPADRGPRTRNLQAWYAIQTRVIDARLQLTVGLTKEAALVAPMVADLLNAEQDIRELMDSLRASAALPRRCDDVMRCGRYLIPVISTEEVPS